MTYVQSRELGSGFGINRHFIVFLDETNKGLINSFSSEASEKVRFWMQMDQQLATKSITDVLGEKKAKKLLQLTLPDLLVDLNVTQLAKRLPKILLSLDSGIRDFFFNPALYDSLDERFKETVKDIIKSDSISAETMKNIWTYENLYNMDPDSPHAYFIAYMIPALLDLMDSESLGTASLAISKHLTSKVFKPLADEKYFSLQLYTQPSKINVKNNGRTLIFQPVSDSLEQSTAHFRGKDWILDHTHLHFEGDGEEREYKFYDSKAQLEAVQTREIADPNNEIVGEVHIVYKRVSSKYQELHEDERKKHYKYMAIGKPLKIGEKNHDIKDILNTISSIDQIDKPVLLDLQKNFQEVFFKDIEPEKVLLHSWGSWRSPTKGFRAGLRFNLIPNPMYVSTNQYERLKQLFGEMQPLSEEKILDPIDRKAGRRVGRQ